MIRVRTTTSTRTVTSMEVDGGSVRGFEGMVRESDDMLTKAEEQGYLNNFQETLHVGNETNPEES